MEKWQVDTQCLEIYQKLLDIANQKGWKGSVFDYYNTFHRYLFCDNNQLHAYRNNNFKTLIDTYGKLISLEEAFKIIKKPSPKSLMIGEYKVIFTHNGIKVGCQIIHKDMVKKIYEKLHKSDCILNLTHDEAQALFALLSKVGGIPGKSRRGHIEVIFNQLRQQYGDYGSNDDIVVGNNCIVFV